MRRYEPVARLQQKGYDDIAKRVVGLRWELLQSALKEDWGAYETIRIRLNRLEGQEIPHPNTRNKNYGYAEPRSVTAPRQAVRRISRRHPLLARGNPYRHCQHS